MLHGAAHGLVLQHVLHGTAGWLHTHFFLFLSLWRIEIMQHLTKTRLKHRYVGKLSLDLILRDHDARRSLASSILELDLVLVWQAGLAVDNSLLSGDVLLRCLPLSEELGVPADTVASTDSSRVLILDVQHGSDLLDVASLLNESVLDELALLTGINTGVAVS